MTMFANTVTLQFSQEQFQSHIYPNSYPDDYGQLVIKARHHINEIEFVGFLEDFSQSTRLLFETVGIPKLSSFNIKLNTTAPEVFDDQMTQRALYLCRYDSEIYAEQIDKYRRSHGGFRYMLTSVFAPVSIHRGKEVIFNDPDFDRIFAHGPYCRLWPGRFEVTVRVSEFRMLENYVHGNGKSLQMEIYDCSTTRSLHIEALSLGPNDSEIDFTAAFDIGDESSSIEFRFTAPVGMYVEIHAHVLVKPLGSGVAAR